MFHFVPVLIGLYLKSQSNPATVHDMLTKLDEAGIGFIGSWSALGVCPCVWACCLACRYCPCVWACRSACYLPSLFARVYGRVVWRVADGVERYLPVCTGVSFGVSLFARVYGRVVWRVADGVGRYLPVCMGVPSGESVGHYRPACMGVAFALSTCTSHAVAPAATIHPGEMLLVPPGSAHGVYVPLQRHTSDHTCGFSLVRALGS